MLAKKTKDNIEGVRL
jgi:hypothetical protein